MNHDKAPRPFSLAVGCLSFALFCWFAGCATTQDVDSLRTDVNRLLKDSYGARSDIDLLKEKITGVAREESFNVVRTSQAEIQSQLSSLAGDVQKLSGRFDENKYHVDKTLKDFKTEIEVLKTQIAAVEKQLRDAKERIGLLEGPPKRRGDQAPEEQVKEAETEKKPDASQKEGQPVDARVEKTPPPADSHKQYEDAYNAFKLKRYREARDKFEAFIRAFPKDERADNAHFWIAETHFNEKDYEGAILAYETHLKKYPKSQKVPAALYKQGLSFVEIGDKKTGIVILEQLIERYPKTSEADLAKKQVAKLKKK